MLLPLLLFLAEIVFWIGVGRAVFLLARVRQWPMPLGMGIVAVVAVLVLWGFFMSPKAALRLEKIPRIIIMTAGMVATGFALFSVGDKMLGTMLLVSAVIAGLGQWIVYEN